MSGTIFFLYVNKFIKRALKRGATLVHGKYTKKANTKEQKGNTKNEPTSTN